MRYQVISVAALAAGALSAAVSNGTNSTTPCGTITSQWIDFYSNDSNSDLPFAFEPELANKCLLSSAIDTELAANYVVEFKKYVEFQTTLSYLKNPPADYWYPPVDILGGLDEIAANVTAGVYTSQYEFDLALQYLLISAHEGHLFTKLCSTAISYQRGVNIVSISSDGIEIPKLYTLSDLNAAADNFTISNVVSINGVDAVAYIEKYALLQTSDPDASFNSMLWNVGQEPTAGVPFGAFTALQLNYYPGPTTEIAFSNGTSRSYPNVAAITASTWSANITDGKSFTEIFCVGPAQEESSSSAAASSSTAAPSATSTTSAAASSSTAPSPTLLGHPGIPIVKDPNNQVAGYFLNGSDYEDTAVLYVPSFDNEQFGNQTTNPSTFQNITREFFQAVKSANKTKLIIDLSGNGGGNTILPNDLFKQLFPDIEPYGASRLRIGTAADIFGQALQAIPNDVLAANSSDDEDTIGVKGVLNTAEWNYRYALTSNLQNFTSWDDMYPPVIENGDNFTALIRAPLNDTYYDETIDALVPYGYAGLPEGPQPFTAENIIVLTDGICASACAIFTEFLTRQAGVKTIVVGGRPQIKPMQAIGGTKGSQAELFTALARISTFLSNLPYFPESLISLANATFPGLTNLPLGSPANLGSFSINLRDNIPQGDDSQIPLQFIFEPANCRIFYTPLTVASPSALWQYAADVAWKGAKCAWGSMDTDVSNNGTGVGNSSGSASSNNTSVSNGAAETSSVFGATIGVVALAAFFVQAL